MVIGDILFFRNRFCLGPTSDLKKQVPEEMRSSRAGGTFRLHKNTKSCSAKFFLEGQEKIHP